MQSLSYFLYGFDIILSIVIIAAAHVYKIVHDSLTNQGFENRNMLSLFFVVKKFVQHISKQIATP